LGHTAIVELLTARRYSLVSRNKDSYILLYLAVLQGYRTVVQILLQKGSDLNTRDYYRRTVLYLAASIGYKEVVYLLLEERVSRYQLGSRAQTTSIP
jgi:ankyrin repeat protein